MKKNTNHIVNFAVFENIVDEVENELDLPSPEHEAPEETELDTPENGPLPGVEPTEDEFDTAPGAKRPAVLHDKGFHAGDTKVMKIAGELEVAAHTGDENLAKEALGKWFEIVHSTKGHIKSLNLSPATISKLTKAVQAIPNHKDLIAGMTGKFGAKPGGAYSKPPARRPCAGWPGS